MIMRLGNSICLIAVGAALRFAVHLPSDRVDIGVIGVIVMLVGVLSLFLSPSDWDRPASWTLLRGLGNRPAEFDEPVPPAWDEAEPPIAPEPPAPQGPPTCTSLRVVPVDPRRHAS
jgi:hypothetical protein